MSVDHSTMTPTEIRLGVWRNGYDPLPLNGKNPSFRKEWQQGYGLNEDYIRDWEKQWSYYRQHRDPGAAHTVPGPRHPQSRRRRNS